MTTIKKLIYLVALWFLLDWAFFNKIKPFIIAQLGLGEKQKTGDATFVDTGGYTYGLDISHYQGKESGLPFKKKDSISYVICKATQGITWDDPAFSYNLKNIKKEGLIWGAYHFYVSADNPDSQATHYLKVVGRFSDEGFPPIVDVEELFVNSNQLLHFLLVVESHTNRTPIIYTNYEVANAYLKDTTFAKYPLWIAHYNNTAPVVLPGTWKGKAWSLWQKSAHYYVNSTANDFDLFNGSLDDLKRFISIH